MDGIAAPAGRASAPPDPAFPGSGRILVGRTREQAILREELAAAIGGRGRLVLVGGEAGIGKTSLASDLLRAADDLGCRVLAGSCYDLTNTPPYGPWLDLFVRYPSDPLPPAPPTFAGGTLATVTDQSALFAEVRGYFAALAAAHPAVVVLEDLHWTDPASLEVLRHVVPHLRRWPILLLLTYRVDELTHRHHFYQQLPALVREADALRLDLGPLDVAGLRALVAARNPLEAADEDRLVRYLERHTEGNPFFATELLRALQDEALLRPPPPRWALGELDRVVVPSLLRHVIDGRVARLGEETRRPLAIAAVIGQEVPLALWAAVAALDEEGLLEIVERAVSTHLLEATRDGTRVRFVHALTRAALYEGILPPRRRAWHRQVAEALLAGAERDPDAVAYHLQEAGDPRAWEWLVKAADRAQRAYAWLTAAERLRAAADLLAGIEGQEQTRSRIICRLAYLLRFSDPAGAIAAVDEAGRLAARIGDAVMSAEVHFFRGNVLCYADRFREALAEIATGLHALEAMPATVQGWFAGALPTVTWVDTTEDEPAVARLHAAGLDVRRGAELWFLASAGHVRAAVDLDERFAAMLTVAPETKQGIRAAAAFANVGRAIAHAALGQPDEARRTFERARELFAAFDHHAVIAFSLLTEARDVAHTYGAADPAARRRLAAGAEAALSHAGGAFRPGVSPRLAWLGCLVLDGRWDEALEILRDLPAPRNSYLRREITGACAELARHRGEPDVAWAQLRPLFPAGPATEPGDLIHQEGLLLQRLVAALCLDAGDLPGARTWLGAHDRWLAWSEGVLGRADGQAAWAGYHLAAGDAARARTAATGALALAGEPEQPLVRLAAHRLLGELETAAQRHAVAGEHLTAALALAVACEVPFERALTLLALAELRLAMGLVDEAAALLDEVRHICVALGAAPTLARADALAMRLDAMHPTTVNPAGLTPREQEVLRLLAQHQTNKEIAAALFVSPRTVQSHVEHICDKLGVGNRRQAAATAARLGLV